MKPAVSFSVDPALPPLTQAASLALALMKATKSTSWAELVADPARLDGFAVDGEQLAMLNEHRSAFGNLRVGPPLVSVAACPVCGRFTVVSGTASTTCPMTLGCKGNPVRASVAAKAKPPARAVAVSPHILPS